MVQNPRVVLRTVIKFIASSLSRVSWSLDNLERILPIHIVSTNRETGGKKRAANPKESYQKMKLEIEELLPKQPERDLSLKSR